MPLPPGLQTENLVMLGIGISQETPLDDNQPRLVDGIHLRWAFKKERGFPWHGFHLFRRKHREGNFEISLFNCWIDEYRERNRSELSNCE